MVTKLQTFWRWLIADFGDVAPRALKYQIFTKLLMAAFIIPLYGLLATYLASEMGAVTNATIMQFLLSWRGAVFAALTLALLLVGFVIEMNGYIVLSARAQHGQSETSYRRLLRYGFSRSKNLWGLGGIILIFYLAVIIPISGVGFNLSFLRGIKLPNFIASFIEFNTWYSLAYFGVVALFAIAGALFIFTLHLIVLCDFKAGRALKTSARLVRENWRGVLLHIGLRLALSAVFVAITVGLWWGVVEALLDTYGADTWLPRVFFSFLLLVQYLATFVFLLIEIPYVVNVVTTTFYTVIKRDDRLWHYAESYPRLPTKHRQSIIDRLVRQWRKIVVVLVTAMTALALVTGTFFEEVFRPDYDVKVAAHRAGGYGTPENSLSGLAYAIDVGAAFTEIDVQRTSDGHYVLNHDESFSRVARDSRTAREMTLAEVRALDISLDRDSSEHPPTLEEFLLAAKGKIKVIIELKGKTADTRMADDVVAMVKKLGMTNNVIIMGLDYDLVRYTETTYPEIDTGYVYFISIGDVTRLTGDYIILEEGEATSARLTALQIAGKKTMVWTVNDRKGMDKLATEDVQAIITDLPKEAIEELATTRELTDTEWFYRIFFDR